MQLPQFLDIFCNSMEHFSQAMDHLENREAELKRQTKRLITWVMGALFVVLLGIAGQIWFFASNMVQVVQSINELTQNMGYTQGVLHGISERVEDMEVNVQKVPAIAGLMQAFTLKLPQITAEIHEINRDMGGFETSLHRLDTNMFTMNGSMQNINLEVQLIVKHTEQFARATSP
jgi:hypothetical protein